MASFFGIFFALLLCVCMWLICDGYRSARLGMEPLDDRLIKLVFMILIPGLWTWSQYIFCRNSEQELDLSPVSVIGTAVCYGLFLWGWAGQDVSYEPCTAETEPLEPREPTQTDDAAAPIPVVTVTAATPERRCATPERSGVTGRKQEQRIEPVHRHALATKPFAVKQQRVIITPRHDFPLWRPLPAQRSVAGSISPAVHQDTPTSLAGAQPKLTTAEISANAAARKAKLTDPYTAEQRAFLFPTSSNVDALNRLLPPDCAYLVAEWLRLSADVMFKMNQSLLFKTGFASSAASSALMADQKLRGELIAVQHRFTLLLKLASRGTLLFWDLSRLDHHWIEQRLPDVELMKIFCLNLAQRYGGVRGCEWTWELHEAVRRFRVAMEGLEKVDYEGLDGNARWDLDCRVSQEMERQKELERAHQLQYEQFYGAASTIGNAASTFQPANDPPFTGQAGIQPQGPMGFKPAATGSFTSTGGAGNTNTFAPAPSTQQPTSQSTGQASTNSSVPPTTDPNTSQPAVNQFGGMGGQLGSGSTGSATGTSGFGAPAPGNQSARPAASGVGLGGQSGQVGAQSGGTGNGSDVQRSDASATPNTNAPSAGSQDTTGGQTGSSAGSAGPATTSAPPNTSDPKKDFHKLTVLSANQQASQPLEAAQDHFGRWKQHMTSSIDTLRYLMKDEAVLAKDLAEGHSNQACTDMLTIQTFCKQIKAWLDKPQYDVQRADIIRKLNDDYWMKNMLLSCSVLTKEIDEKYRMGKLIKNPMESSWLQYVKTDAKAAYDVFSKR